MKSSKFIRFLRNGLFLVLVVSLVLILSCAGYTQQEAKVIRQSGTARYLIDPAIGSDLVSSIALCNIYDSLVFPNPDGSVKPWLAKSWEISADELTYTFELVPGVKFRNGDELTADDVVFSLERIMTIGEGFGYLFTASVEGVKALEKYKVQITLKKTFGPFLGALVRLYILNKNQVIANIQKEGHYGEYGDYGRGWLVTHDAGSGPYQVKENKIPEYLLLEKFDDYWAGWENKEDAPQYWKQLGTREAITVRALFSRGEMEMTDKAQTRETLLALEQSPDVELSTHNEGELMTVMFNTKKPPTDDIHFRKALAYCFDYKQSREKIFFGSRPSGPIPSSFFGYNPNLKLYTRDLVKAEEELKQSPYYGKLDQYNIELHWVATSRNAEKAVLMFQVNAAELGIKLNLVKSPWLVICDEVATVETTPNLLMVIVSAHYAEAGSLLMSNYHSESVGTWEQAGWLQDPEIDAVIDDALQAIDKEERLQKYYVAQEKIFELCPTIWICELGKTIAYRADYIVYPAAETAKQGKPISPVSGYSFYFRDFKVFPEKAHLPYTPFEP